MTDPFKQCEQLKSARLRQICRGETNLPHWKVNAYLVHQGLQPLYDNVSLPLSVTNKIGKKTESPKFILEGPGTEFAKIVSRLGIKMNDGCGCKAAMLKMNALGVAGCRENRENIIALIKSKMSDWGWTSLVQSWASAAFNYTLFPELWTRVSPLDPIPGIFDYAVELAEGGPT